MVDIYTDNEVTIDRPTSKWLLNISDLHAFAIFRGCMGLFSLNTFGEWRFHYHSVKRVCSKRGIPPKLQFHLEELNDADPDRPSNFGV